MSEDTPQTSDRQILTDANGRPTHVVLTIETYRRIAELIEDADDVVEVERRMKNPEFVSLDEVKDSLGLHHSD